MNKKILVVEDSLTFRNYLEQLLSQAGYHVFAAENIAQAKSILNAEKDILCAVLDYCLPDGEDGEVIELALTHQHKVIVLTALFNPELREHMLAKGVVDYLLKDSTASVSYILPLIQRLERNQQHKCLVVDDSATVRNHVVQLLEHQYISTRQAENGVEAIKALQNDAEITFVISDHDMPEKDGITMIREIRQQSDRTRLPILGLSGSEDPTLTAQFLKAGANDFLNKPFNPEEFYCRVHQILNMQEATQELYRMANQDALTGLWNRRYLFNQACNGCEARNIAMLDIDFFKAVNDTYGHDGGDAVLVTVAKILQLYFPDDVIARFGGEEFCIQACGSFDHFTSRLEKLRQRIANTSIPYQDTSITVTISIGVATMQESLDAQIKLADDRLYAAKDQGRNLVIAQ
ncbi:Two-component response regulator ORR11 [Vibrio scophthalmi]|uniref:response regulator n=1 Tax=Vibrio scophthalmi TaxID=45658 RepID=UPI0008095163|nr:response regulator [Vibrio scophthalmi]ANS84624.1 Two-component response regulator ORR11 [Vibrio scophthalmi]